MVGKSRRDYQSVYEVFSTLLKTLCLQEFPCGSGTWRSDVRQSTNTIDIRSTTEDLTHCETEKASAQFVAIESLRELALKPPYEVDCSWSEEAKELREISVKTPERLTWEFIRKHFKTLRIVDKHVNEVDSELLQFCNLKELRLSANFINDVDSKNLPPSLQVLELTANRIEDIGSLFSSPPSLIHLGLGYNYIQSLYDHMKPEKWQCLLSLDLSYNNLDDLVATVTKLKYLPKLQNLLLHGNPLSLVRGYRGYTVDAIRQLSILDDTRITADEKHYFKGLSKLKELNMEENYITVSVSNVSGVPMPEELEDPEAFPEFPKIQYKYQVQFDYLMDALKVTPRAPETDQTNNDQEEVRTISPLPTTPEPWIPSAREEDLGHLYTQTTPPIIWSESLEFNYKQMFCTENLITLRNFLKDGVKFTLIQCKHSYLLEDPNPPLEADRQTPTGSKAGDKGKGDKGKDKVKSAKGGKDAAKGKPDKAKKDGKGKKDKMDFSDMFELPREFKVLGSCHIPLESILDGDHSTSVQDMVLVPEVSQEDQKQSQGDETDGRTSKADTGSVAGKTDASDKKKGGKNADADKSKGGGKGKGGGKSAVAKGKEDKAGGKGGKGVEKVEEELEEEAPPVPLTISLEFKIHHWKTAKEAAQELEAMLAANESNNNPPPQE